MIQYTPNRDWFSDLKHLGTSWTIRRLVRAALAVGVYALALSFVLLRLDLEGQRSISGTFSLLGVILSIVLAFRTSTAYDRWWEGRQQWGTLVNHSRNLAIQLDAVLPPEDLTGRREFARLVGNFAVALSGHLRGGVDPTALVPAESDWDGATPEEDPPAGQLPAEIARTIVARIHAARRDGAIDGTDVVLTKAHTAALLDVLGACERIRKTPIPFSYSVFIKLFVVLYALILPVGLVPEYGYLAVPLTMLIVFALLGLELMAEEIEDPFGLDCNDLPTGALAAAIRRESAELLGLGTSKEPPVAASYSKVF